MTNGTSVEQQRQMIYEVSEAIAPSWEERREFVEDTSAPVRTWMLRELGARPGQTVLEVAAGVGETGFEAAAVVGEQGRLISTDFSPRMVEAARRRGTELGLTNVDYRVTDAADTGLEDRSIDGVLCRFGYMLMPDPAAAVAEARRVLRPGGRLVLAVWGAPERNPFFTAMAMTLVQRGVLPPPDPDGPGVFALADPEGTRALVDGAGFTTVRTEEVPLRFAVRNAEEYVAVVADTAGPIGLAVQGLADADREDLTEEIASTITRFATDGGYEFPGIAVCAVGS
jgi:ubiquinone/menaquinone biosynthesis C-methylase UbiE